MEENQEQDKKTENSIEEQNLENVTNETTESATTSISETTENAESAANVLNKSVENMADKNKDTNVTKENTAVENTNQTESNDSNNEHIFNINTEMLKKQTSETVNEVKNTLKNTDIKKDSKEAKGFFSSFFKDPIGKIKEVGSSSENKFLKIAIILLVIWLFTILVVNVGSIANRYLFGILGNFPSFFKNLFANFFPIIKAFVAPIITVLILSGLVYGFKKNRAKSFIGIVNGILIAKIPVILASVFSLLTLISSKFVNIATSFSGFCSILSTILLYFVMKSLSDEEKNDSYFWKFALIMGIFYIIKFVFSYLEIYI